MAQKHLRELLSEDQEPFLLKTYITDRKSQLSRPTTAGKLTKPAPRRSSSNFAGSFCKSACLFSVLPYSPDPRKSPLFDFAAASPHKSPNRIFLHVPAETASLLLEAAVRIQHKGAKPIKQKPVKRGPFGSILKRLVHRKRAAPTREIESERRRSFGACIGGAPVSELKSAAGKVTSSWGCRAHSRRISGLWSQSNGERSLDLETSTSGSNSVELAAEEEEVYAAFNESLCGSPFRFVLQRSPSSSSERTPEFASPVASPARHGKEDINHCDVGGSKKLNSGEEEEEREQCSPVSVLDSPFENGQDQEVEDDGFDCECSFANVERAKQQLLEKLRRFEKLAELDPDELEKKMLELDGDGGEDDGHMSRESSDDDEEPEPSDEGFRGDWFITEVPKSKFDRVKIIPSDMKKLVSDLVGEEQGRQNGLGVTFTGRVCERLESWKRVNLNTTGKAVQEDSRGELDGWKWKQNQDQVDEVAIGIEFTISGILVEELLEDLTGKCWCG